MSHQTIAHFKSLRRGTLREAQKKPENEQLEQLLLAGLDRGARDIEVTGAFWKKLRAEASHLTSQRKTLE